MIMCEHVCRVCGTTLVEAENWRSSTAKQKSYICNACDSQRAKEYRQRGYKKPLAARARDRYMQSQKHQEMKQAIMEAYGGKCECCGENQLIYLSVDHINCDGAEHRRELKKSGTKFYEWLVANDYPTGFRVLCMNCNTALGMYGYCPHHHARPQPAPKKEALPKGVAALMLGDYCRTCRVPLNDTNAQYPARPSEVRDGITRHEYVCKSCQKIKMSEYAFRQKVEVFAEYGGKCATCGESRTEFLTIDHIHNDGAEQRKKMGISGGSSIYAWLKKNGYPKDEFQALCFNCNVAKGILHRRSKPYSEEVP